MDLRGPVEGQALAERIRAGDTEAYERLLREYWPPLVRFARRMLPDRDDSQDVVQDVFVRLWRRRSALKTTGSLRAMLFTMTRNAALDELRRHGRREKAAAAFEGPADPSLPSQDVAGRDLERAVRAAVAALPPKRREVFRLVREEGLSYNDVATVLSVSPQTVANHMSLALTDLRRALGDHLPPEAAP